MGFFASPTQNPDTDVDGTPKGSSEKKRSTELIKIGDIIPFDSVTTVTGKQINLKDSKGLIHLYFGRFSGCPICNFHYKQYSTKASDFENWGLTPVFIIHSSQDVIIENQMTLPWSRHLNFVADPKMKLYQLVGAEQNVLGLFSWKAIKEACAFQNEHGKFKRKGDEMTTTQMPCEFLLDASNGRIVANKRGKAAADRWTVTDIEELAEQLVKFKGTNNNSHLTKFVTSA